MSSAPRQKRTRAEYEAVANAVAFADSAANATVQAAQKARTANVAVEMTIAASDAALPAAAAAGAPSAAADAAAAAAAGLAAQYSVEYVANAAIKPASCPRFPLSNHRLCDLPVDVLRRIFTYFAKCPGDGTLDDASVEALREIFALSRVCPQLHAMLASLFHSVYFDVNLRTPAKCIVNFADSLKHVSLPGSADSAYILEELVRRKSPLESLELSASGIPGLARSYIRSLRKMSLNYPATLRYLRLSYVNIGGNVDCTALERAVENLRALAIVGAHERDYERLSDLLRLTAPSLMHLELRNLEVVSQSFFIDIRAATPGLRHLDLINVTAKSSSTILHFIVSYGSNLCHLGLWHTHYIGGRSRRVLAKDLLQIMRKCAGLKSLHVDQPLFQERNLAFKALQTRGSTLRSIRLCRCDLRTCDISALAKALPALQEFVWEDMYIHCNAVAELCALKGHTLKSLVIRSETGFDHRTSKDLYFTIGTCAQLQELTLGSGKSRSSYVPEGTQSLGAAEYFTAMGTSWSSNAPVVKLFRRATGFQRVIFAAFMSMLKCLGPKLRMLSLQGDLSWLDKHAVDGVLNMGTIDGADLMQLIGIYCRKLKLLHMEGIRSRTGFRSEYETAFAQLRRRLPNTALYIDRPLPHRFGRTWNGREMQDCGDLSFAESLQAMYYD